MNTRAKIFVFENVILLSICLVIVVMGMVQESRIVALAGAGVFGLLFSLGTLFLKESELVQRLIGIYAAAVFFFLYVLDHLFIDNTLFGVTTMVAFAVILLASTLINLKNPR